MISTERVRGRRHVEPVALPGELQLAGVGTVGLPLDAEPRTADAEDLELLAGRSSRMPDFCFQKPTTIPFRSSISDGLVVVVPAVEAVHLDADRPVADLVAADSHEVLVRGVHPAVGGVDGVVLGHDPPVADPLGLAVDLEPGVPELLELGAGVVWHHVSSWGAGISTVSMSETVRAIAGQYLTARCTFSRRDSGGSRRARRPCRRRSFRPNTVGCLELAHLVSLAELQVGSDLHRPTPGFELVANHACR